MHTPAALGRRCGPVFVLLLALAITLLVGPDRRYFYSIDGLFKTGIEGPVNHDTLTRNHMKVARNLAAEHNFLGFYHLRLTPDGDLTYHVYNRFPVGGYVLIKLATLPFSDDLAASLRAARLLMLAFFAGAAMLAYLSLSRLIANRWAAVGATLLALASQPVLFYRDMVATEGIIDLFGMMLVFHGIAVFSAPSVKGGDLDEGAGFGQLLVKTCGGLLLGWHAYGLVLPFVGLGLAGVLAHRDKRGDRDCPRVRQYLILGVVALLFGVTVLGFNFAREYFALGGETPLADLPSVRSMLGRSLIEFAPSGDWTWGWSAPSPVEQFRRAGAASAPAALIMFFPGRVLAVLGIAVLLSTVGLLCLRSTPRRLPLTVLALSGFWWSLLVSKNRSMNFEGMFYPGIPMVFFSLVLLRLKWLRVWRLRPALPTVHGSGLLRWAWSPATSYTAVALTVFTVSSLVVEQGKKEFQDVEVEKALTADMHAIRPLVKNKVVFTSPLWYRGYAWQARLRYSLSDSAVMAWNHEFADFVVAPRLEEVDSLTPENQYLFLYRPGDVDTYLLSYEQRARTRMPVIESTWDVYHLGNDLLYVGEGSECMNPDPLGFFLLTYPVHAEDLGSRRRCNGFDLRNFGRGHGWQRDGKCYVLVSLPTYEIVKIVTGQSDKGPFDSSFRPLWQASYSPRADGKKRS